MKTSKCDIYLFLILRMCLASFHANAQGDTSVSTFRHANPPAYTVKYALEVESLVPMFFAGGYHFAFGYRFQKFRVRASVINGGNYNAETAGIKNSFLDFKIYYTTSPGVFFG